MHCASIRGRRGEVTDNLPVLESLRAGVAEGLTCTLLQFWVLQKYVEWASEGRGGLANYVRQGTRRR